MSARALSLAILMVTLTATVIFCVGFAPPHWIKKDFVLHIKGAFLIEENPLIGYVMKMNKVPSIIVKHFNETEQNVTVSSNIGLFKSCKDKSVTILTKLVNKSDCGKKGARDWQKIAFGLAAAALVFAVADIIMSLLAVAVKRLQENMRFRFGIVICNFCTAGLAVSPVIMYVFNKRIQVKPPLPDIIDYDLDWGLYVTAASSCLFALLVLLNALYLVGFSFKNSNQVEEPTQMYSKSFSN